MASCALVTAWPHKRGQRQCPKSKWWARVRSAANTGEAHSQVGWMNWKKSQNVNQTQSRLSSQNEGQVRHEGGIGWGLVDNMGRTGLSSFLSEKEHLFSIHGYVWVTWYFYLSLEIDLLANLLQKDNSHLPHSLIELCLGVSSCQGKDIRMIKMLSSSPKS